MSIDASGVSLSAGLPCVKPSRTASSLSLQAHRFAPFSHFSLTRPPLHLHRIAHQRDQLIEVLVGLAAAAHFLLMTSLITH
jgi:hypothetical protein